MDFQIFVHKTPERTNGDTNKTVKSYEKLPSGLISKGVIFKNFLHVGACHQASKKNYVLHIFTAFWYRAPNQKYFAIPMLQDTIRVTDYILLEYFDLFEACSTSPHQVATPMKICHTVQQTPASINQMDSHILADQ